MLKCWSLKMAQKGLEDMNYEVKYVLFHWSWKLGLIWHFFEENQVLHELSPLLIMNFGIVSGYSNQNFW